MNTPQTWLLCIDRYSFHVYITVLDNTDDDEMRGVRIDWCRDSSLEFSKFKFHRRERYIFVGEAVFDQNSISRCIKHDLKRYDISDFNCRTVSALVLCHAGFDKKKISRMFEKNDILCGLKDGECFRKEEFKRYLAWEEGKNGGCIIS
jgi:hypothetical protein